jgi:oxygen-independent coproporphyrinogen III oxidase
MKKSLGLYLHIPFCAKKCKYCDFVSYAKCDNYIDDYIEYISREMTAYKGMSLKTIFFGGGTPSILSEKQINFLFDNINKNFCIEKNAEITFEANPDSLTKNKIDVLKENNVNRISLGIQSFNDEILSSMARIHDSSRALKVYYELKDKGFENINIDLISAWPTDTLSSYKMSLQKIKLLNPNHVAIYVLNIEDETELANLIKLEKIKLHDKDIEADFYELTIDFLLNNGYSHYEISNFCKTGYECKHNMIYWNNEDYIGLGASAVSYIDGVRYKNPDDLKNYFDIVKMEKCNTRQSDIISEKQKIGETIFLNLRKLNEGINLNTIQERFNCDILKIYEKEFAMLENYGLISRESNIFKLTRRGVMISNEVFSYFV